MFCKFFYHFITVVCWSILKVFNCDHILLNLASIFVNKARLFVLGKHLKNGNFCVIILPFFFLFPLLLYFWFSLIYLIEIERKKKGGIFLGYLLAMMWIYRYCGFTSGEQAYTKEDIWSVPQCTMLLCYSGSTSHNAQCFYDDHDQFSQFSPHCRIHVHSSIILKDTVWIAEFSWFSSLFGIFRALLSLDNLNR